MTLCICAVHMCAYHDEQHTLLSSNIFTIALLIHDYDYSWVPLIIWLLETLQVIVI